MIVLVCDRCGGEAGETRLKVVVDMYAPDKLLPGWEWDLCDGCSKGLKRWVKKHG